MDSILLVSSSDKSVTFFMETLAETGMKITVARTAREARSLFLQQDYTICLVNSPLEGGGGEHFAKDAVSTGLTQVILLVREEDFSAVSAWGDKAGLFSLSRPVSKKSLLQAMHFAMAAYSRLRAMQEANRALMLQVREVRLVARAKCILMQYLNMTEAQAHRYIEKQAMDMRLSRLNVAENILKTYES